jgi:uncharacterized protein YjiS (DUF1127 family)
MAIESDLQMMLRIKSAFRSIHWTIMQDGIGRIMRAIQRLFRKLWTQQRRTLDLPQFDDRLLRDIGLWAIDLHRPTERELGIGPAWELVRTRHVNPDICHRMSDLNRKTTSALIRD